MRGLVVPSVERKKRSSPPCVVSGKEKQVVLNSLHSERFMDKAPHEVYAILLDEGKCRFSIQHHVPYYLVLLASKSASIRSIRALVTILS